LRIFFIFIKYNQKMKKIIILFILIVFFSCKENSEKAIKNNELKVTTTPKQSTDSIKWENELCTNNSIFNSKLFSRKQLNDTYELFFKKYEIINFKAFPSFRLNEKAEPIDTLEARYLQQKNKIEKLDVVNVKYWINYKKICLSYLKNSYNKQKTAWYCYENPEQLNQFDYNKKTKYYVDAIVSNDSTKMVEAWRKLTAEMKKDNGSPESLEKDFLFKSHSKDCKQYARMALFSFGWWNKFDAFETPEYQKTLNINMQNAYKKLMISTVSECDEP
jgi:hypothetical protein